MYSIFITLIYASHVPYIYDSGTNPKCITVFFAQTWLDQACDLC